MKKTFISITSFAMSVLMVVCLASCTKTEDKTGLWENATYVNDEEFGEVDE